MLGKAMWGHFMVFTWVVLFLFISKFGLRQFHATAWIADEY